MHHVYQLSWHLLSSRDGSSPNDVLSLTVYLTDILFDMFSDILSDILFDIHYDTLFDIHSDFLSDSFCWHSVSKIVSDMFK